jgi:hypothetical protein
MDGVIAPPARVGQSPARRRLQVTGHRVVDRLQSQCTLPHEQVSGFHGEPPVMVNLASTVRLCRIAD